MSRKGASDALPTSGSESEVREEIPLPAVTLRNGRRRHGAERRQEEGKIGRKRAWGATREAGSRLCARPGPDFQLAWGTFTQRKLYDHPRERSWVRLRRGATPALAAITP